MSFNSVHPRLGDPKPSDRPELPGTLTDAQRNFAQVVGQALADAWRRHLQQSGSRDSSLEGAK